LAKIAVKQNPEKEVPTEVMAESIVSLAAGIRKLRTGRLNDRALFLLIQDAAPTVGRNNTKLSMRDIKAVFDGIDSLEGAFLRKRPGPK
jgi:hypothetical protein